MFSSSSRYEMVITLQMREATHHNQDLINETSHAFYQCAQSLQYKGVICFVRIEMHTPEQDTYQQQQQQCWQKQLQLEHQQQPIQPIPPFAVGPLPTSNQPPITMGGLYTSARLVYPHSIRFPASPSVPATPPLQPNVSLQSSAVALGHLSAQAKPPGTETTAIDEAKK